MVTQVLTKRILVDGAILTALVAPILVLTLYINPRLALSDYPEDVKAAVPPRTKKELRQGILIGLPFVITKIAEIVEEACAKETNIFGYGIWTHHITQVARNGKRLAKLFNADPEIVEIAALLHDYASIKDKALYKDHHVHSPVEAEKVLRRFGYPQERIEAVKHCIAAHRGSVAGGIRSAEAECLANADAMAHIEQVPALLELAFVQHGMGIDEGAGWVRAKLERSWNKLSPQVQEMMREKYEAALITLTVLNHRCGYGSPYEGRIR